MKYLAISASQKRASISLFVDQLPVFNIEAERDIQPSQWFNSALYMFSEFYIDLLNSLDFIALDTGPGSFTGIKVATAFVKGLVQKNNTPVVCVNSLEATAILAPFNKKTVIIKNARKSLYFFAVYDRLNSSLVAIVEPTAQPKEKIIEITNSLDDFVVCIDNADFDNIWDKFMIKSSPPLSEGVGIIGFERYKNLDFINENDIKPLYLREPDAVLNLKLTDK